MESELGAVADAERLLRSAAGRELCRLVALVPGFGPVRTPMMRRVGRPGPQPTRRQLLDEMATVIGTGNHRRPRDRLTKRGSWHMWRRSWWAVVSFGASSTTRLLRHKKRTFSCRWRPLSWLPRRRAGGPQPVAIDDQHLVHQDLGYGIAPPRPGHVHSDVRARMQQERSAEAQARGRRRHVPPGRKGRPVVGVAARMAPGGRPAPSPAWRPSA